MFLQTRLDVRHDFRVLIEQIVLLIRVRLDVVKLAAAWGNSRLKREIARYRLLVRGFCRMTGREATLLQALQEHMQILEALEKRTPGAARRAMAAHIDARLQAVLVDLEAAEK